MGNSTSGRESASPPPREEKKKPQKDSDFEKSTKDDEGSIVQKETVNGKPNTNMTTSGTESTRSSTVSIPDLADPSSRKRLENPDFAHTAIFEDHDKGKPIFTKKGPPSSAGSARSTDENDNLGNSGNSSHFSRDLDQMSLTSDDFL